MDPSINQQCMVNYTRKGYKSIFKLISNRARMAELVQVDIKAFLERFFMALSLLVGLLMVCFLLSL